MKREIPVSFHTYGGWFVGHVVGLGHRNAETRMHQYRQSFDPNACLHLARGWVAAKIANSRTLLSRNWRGAAEEDDGEPFEQFDVPPSPPGGGAGGEGSSSVPTNLLSPSEGEGSFPEPAATKPPTDRAPEDLLRDLKEDARHAQHAGNLEELLGIEGIAARRYFQNFTHMLRRDDDPSLSFDFMGRNRRPPKDPVNAMLTREWHIDLSAVGLDPYRGYYHQPRFGRPALTLDMMEPFRSIIADSAVITAINNGEVHGTDFIRAAGSCAMSDSGRKRFIAAFERRMGHEVTHPLFGYSLSYRRLLEIQAHLLIRYLSGEIPDYPNLVTR